MTGRRSSGGGIDPLIHEASRLLIVSVLNECDVADFTFLLATTALTRGNLSTHVARLVKAGYVGEKKEIVQRKSHTEYWLTREGRAAFTRYKRAWKRLVR